MYCEASGESRVRMSYSSSEYEGDNQIYSGVKCEKVGMAVTRKISQYHSAKTVLHRTPFHCISFDRVVHPLIARHCI